MLFTGRVTPVVRRWMSRPSLWQDCCRPALITGSAFSTAPPPKSTVPAQKDEPSERDYNYRMLRLLGKHLWPTASMAPDSRELRLRVLGSCGLMVGSKLITIQVPFIFKEIIDVCHTDLVTTGEAGQTLAEVAAEPSFFVPAAIVLGYGVARSSAVAFSELRNSIFSTVALRATRQVSLDVFTHLQARELQFHLDRKIGTLSRVMDRGGRSINSALSSMLFSVVPTALEIGMVSAILGTQFGVAHSAVTALTVGAYTVFTINYSNTRIPIRKEMNDAENEAHQRSIDALVNYETVKYFGAEKLEEDRYNESLVKYSEAAQRTQKTLSILNVGQNVIFSAGLTAIMGLTTASIVSGDATVGDLVLVNGLLFQVGHRLCCVFYTGGQVPELVV